MLLRARILQIWQPPPFSLSASSLMMTCIRSDMACTSSSRLIRKVCLSGSESSERISAASAAEAIKWYCLFRSPERLEWMAGAESLHFEQVLRPASSLRSAALVATGLFNGLLEYLHHRDLASSSARWCADGATSPLSFLHAQAARGERDGRLCCNVSRLLHHWLVVFARPNKYPHAPHELDGKFESTLMGSPVLLKPPLSGGPLPRASSHGLSPRTKFADLC